MKTYHFSVTGYVQGVSYRRAIKEYADRLGVTGEIENMADGSVRVFANLDEAETGTFVEALYQGSFASRVEAIRKREIEYRDFETFGIVR